MVRTSRCSFPPTPSGYYASSSPSIPFVPFYTARQSLSPGSLSASCTDGLLWRGRESLATPATICAAPAAGSAHHVLHGGPVVPAARLLQRLHAPDSSGAVEAKELVEVALHLLLHLEVIGEVDVLEARQQVLPRVHKRPPRLRGMGRSGGSTDAGVESSEHAASTCFTVDRTHFFIQRLHEISTDRSHDNSTLLDANRQTHSQHACSCGLLAQANSWPDTFQCDQVPAAHLHQRQLRLPLKVGNRFAEKVASWHKVGIQDGHKLAVLGGGVLHAVCQVARLVPRAHRAVEVEDGGARGAPGVYLLTDERLHVILVRVVQHLEEQREGVGVDETGVADSVTGGNEKLINLTVQTS